jgi:hypothetical protein
MRLADAPYCVRSFGHALSLDPKPRDQIARWLSHADPTFTKVADFIVTAPVFNTTRDISYYLG